MISHSLETLADFVSMQFKWDTEWELEENPLFTKKALFPLASALHPVGASSAGVLVGKGACSRKEHGFSLRSE